MIIAATIARLAPMNHNSVELSEPRIDRVLAWATIITGALIPLVWLPLTAGLSEPLVDGYIFPKTLFLRLSTVILVGLLLIKFIRYRRIGFKADLLSLLFIGFLLTTVISYFFALDRRLALFGVPISAEGLVTYLNYALLFFIAKSLGTPANIVRLIKAVAVSTGLTALMAIVQIKFGVFPGPAEPGLLMMGPVGNAVTMAGFLALAVPLLLIFGLRKDLTGPWLYIVAGSSTAAVAALLMTDTIVAQIAVALTFSLALLGRVRAGHKTAARRLVAVLLFATIIAIIPSRGSPTSLDPHSFQAHSISVAERTQIWKQTRAMTARYLVTGAGLDNYGVALEKEVLRVKDFIPAQKPFSFWLEMLIATGIVGLIFFLSFYLFLLLSLARIRKLGSIDTTIVFALLAALSSYFIFLSFFFSTTNTGPLFFITAGLSAGLVASQKNDPTKV